MQFTILKGQGVILLGLLGFMKAEFFFDTLIFSSKEVDAVFDFWRDSEFDFLLDFGLDSGGSVLDFEDGAVESLVLLCEVKDTSINFRGDFELNSVVNSGLCGWLLHFIEPNFALFDIIFSVHQVLMNFFNDNIQPVNLFQQENLLQGHLGQFLFEILRDNLHTVGNCVGDGFGLENGLLLDLGHTSLELENKVLGVNQVAVDLLEGVIEAVDLFEKDDCAEFGLWVLFFDEGGIDADGDWCDLLLGGSVALLQLKHQAVQPAVLLSQWVDS